MEGLRPRLMTRAQAAAYCAMTASRFSQLVKAGTFPGPIPGTTRWDRVAIDAALDRHSGISPSKNDRAGAALDEWLSRRQKS